MKATLKFLPIIILGGLIASCATDERELEVKKNQLAELKTQANEIAESIRTLEAEIAELDPDFARSGQKSILISTTNAKKDRFVHYVEVTGSVVSKKNVSISSESAGVILEIPAVEGMRVSKGTVLAKIDPEAIQRNIDELTISLDLAKTLFEKQERLWRQEIGTEIQYLEAKNRKESLERSLATLRTQLQKTVVKAPFDGTIESINVRLGELVQPGSAMFQFVGENDLFIEADVSEAYVGVLTKGDSVEVYFPSIEQDLKTKVSAIGSIINPNNRTFKAEVFLPSISEVKPNMLAVLKIKDYENSSSVIVPNYLILSDNRGDYIFTVEENIARKKYVKRGKTFNNETEILEGLVGDEILVDKGFREVGDNFNVNISKL
ncbi:efflux RND transporter periplasmic adaptor subunit [Algoriphagus sp. CAU 1675]|uniref:efflux RND transporter periplasmic adaptor subunit n=1 Tax=Algoriphagus sp. CAU 1675 TaxID=3032597 RepID=UPI0023DB6886|nr:efflux RND transporter periplasmic adaptor subunit [Algoriphagus sp. CAU 1675]MDF2157076.1 efflux RND transporter periplasmic adaptor subunit [Algoriphagus sp. CAU 1675]